jgi:hypothetical protein
MLNEKANDVEFRIPLRMECTRMNALLNTMRTTMNLVTDFFKSISNSSEDIEEIIDVLYHD